MDDFEKKIEEAKEAPLTMFPKTANEEFSVYADWRILAGAILMFCGFGGALLLIMKAVSEGMSKISELCDYCGSALLIFSLMIIGGFLLSVIMIVIRKNKHDKEEGKRK